MKKHKHQHRWAINIFLGSCCLALGTAVWADAEPATASNAPASVTAVDRIGAFGIGVKDLKASTEFYQDVLGLVVLRTYELGYINEIVLGYPGGGAVLVLMNWPGDTARRYDGNDVKVVFYVEDPVAVIDKIRKRGLKVDREATPIEVLNGAIVGLGRDPDKYVVEVLTR